MRNSFIAMQYKRFKTPNELGVCLSANFSMKNYTTHPPPQKNNIYMYIFSAIKWLITINHIKKKGFCLHNIWMCTVYIYYVYINTQTYSIYFENICMYIHLYIQIHIFYIIYKYI